MKFNLKACACAALMSVAGPALGAASCSIQSVPTLGFPTYDVFNSAPTVTSQIAKIKCTGLGSSDFTVGFGQSATSGTISGRQMAQSAGSGRLNYNIYKDGGYSSLWGDGTAGTTALVVTGGSGNNSVPIFGKIDPGQDAPVGNYSDSVVMSVNP